jgi:glycosyltransferase involved in cell wall biosynthesis
MTRRRILAVTTSPLPYGEQITDGPGYRMWNLLQEVRRSHEVHVLSLYESFHQRRGNLEAVSEGGVHLERPSHSPRVVSRRVREIDPDVIYYPWSASPFVGNANRDIPTILDFCGPGLLESFAGQGHIPAPLLRQKLDSFWGGDFLITTSDRQRFYILGLLAASGRLTMGTFARDDPLVHVVRLTPPAEPPRATTLRPEREGEELIVLLAGAFLPWYDYSKLASSIKQLDDHSRSAIRLVVVGANPRMPEVEERVRGAFGGEGVRDVVHLAGYVPFSKRAEYYLGADVALSIGPHSVEDELSSRTRIIDYLWAGLPVITSGRDEYSAMFIDAGAAFPFGQSPSSLAETLERLAEDRTLIAAAKARMDKLRAGPFNPSNVAKPVLDFIDYPHLTENRSWKWRGPFTVALWLRDLAKAIKSGRM